MNKSTAINLNFENGKLQSFDSCTGISSKGMSDLDYEITRISRDETGKLSIKEYACGQKDLTRFEGDENLATRQGNFANEINALEYIKQKLGGLGSGVHETTINLGGVENTYTGPRMELGLEAAKLLVDNRLAELSPAARTLAAQSYASSEKGKASVAIEGDGGERAVTAVPTTNMESLVALSLGEGNGVVKR